jgi:hypothetical protein
MWAPISLAVFFADATGSPTDGESDIDCRGSHSSIGQVAAAPWKRALVIFLSPPAIVMASAAYTRPLLPSTRSSQDQIGDLFGMRHPRQVTRLHLYSGRIHAFCEKSLQVRIDCLIELRDRIE